MESGTVLLTQSTNPNSIDIFQSNESLLDFYVFEATFIFLIIFFTILYRLIKF